MKLGWNTLTATTRPPSAETEPPCDLMRATAACSAGSLATWLPGPPSGLPGPGAFGLFGLVGALPGPIVTPLHAIMPRITVNIRKACSCFMEGAPKRERIVLRPATADDSAPGETSEGRRAGASSDPFRSSWPAWTQHLLSGCLWQALPQAAEPVIPSCGHVPRMNLSAAHPLRNRKFCRCRTLPRAALDILCRIAVNFCSIANRLHEAERRLRRQASA